MKQRIKTNLSGDAVTKSVFIEFLLFFSIFIISEKRAENKWKNVLNFDILGRTIINVNWYTGNDTGFLVWKSGKEVDTKYRTKINLLGENVFKSTNINFLLFFTIAISSEHRVMNKWKHTFNLKFFSYNMITAIWSTGEDGGFLVWKFGKEV